MLHRYFICRTELWKRDGWPASWETGKQKCLGEGVKQEVIERLSGRWDFYIPTPQPSRSGISSTNSWLTQLCIKHRRTGSPWNPNLFSCFPSQSEWRTKHTVGDINGETEAEMQLKWEIDQGWKSNYSGVRQREARQFSFSLAGIKFTLTFICLGIHWSALDLALCSSQSHWRPSQPVEPQWLQILFIPRRHHNSLQFPSDSLHSTKQELCLMFVL